jgi:DNA-binding NtrC family response regulator
MAADKPVVAVCGTTGADLEEVVAALSRELHFGVMPVRWPDSSALAAARHTAAAFVLVSGASREAGEALELALAQRGATVPLVGVGGLKVPNTATCWVARSAIGSLNQVLSLLIPPSVPAAPESDPPPSRSWRRKSDMIIGVSASVRALLATLDRLAGSVAPVLITGESGTGKELVARALHYTGSRSSAPFIPINCAAIPEALFEAELFGYQRGAFTGAVASRPGAFETADGGTLFLDEIGEMHIPLQAKLLRVLETGEVTRLGSNDRRRSNVRVVAATNRNLSAEVRAGRFREDLFYRVSVYPVLIPPLRDRPEDIPPLVAHHLEEIARRERRTMPRLTHEALERLLTHRWPGNVRELINALERAILLAEQNVIDLEHIVLPRDCAETLIAPYRDAKEQFELDYYSRLLRTAGGNISLVAKLAQKTRKEVYDALKKLGLEAGEYRESSGRAKAAAPVAVEDGERR